jgi:ketosteroid isomerase-like protein
MRRALAAILLAIAGSTFASAQCTDADRQKLEAWDKALGDASQRGDRASLQSAYADDYVGMVPWGTLDKATTVDNAVRAAERNKANPAAAPALRYDHYDIACTPTTAVITHRNVSTAKRDGKEVTDYSRSVHVLEKRGGTWVLVSNAGSPLDDAGTILYMEREWNDAAVRNDVAWFERNYATTTTGSAAARGCARTRRRTLKRRRAARPRRSPPNSRT